MAVSVVDPTTGGRIPDECMNLAPKWLLNGFPKAGLHYCELMMRPLSIPMPPGQLHGAPFVGTFAGRSWTTEWIDVEQFMYHVSRLQPGHHFYAHIGHQTAIEAFLYYLGVAHVFIVRDFRDIAVSQAHHVWDDNDNLAHPDKEMYRNLSSFDKALEACIVGLNQYAGVMERWAYYAPWVEACEDWCYLWRYERARQEPEVVAREVVRYGVARVGQIFGYHLRADGPALDRMVDKMVEAGRQQAQSLTFRKGSVGDWREVFTERHKELFKQTDKDNWLARLGYAQSDDW